MKFIFLWLFLCSFAQAQIFAGFDFKCLHNDFFDNNTVIPEFFFSKLPEDSISLLKRRKEWVFAEKFTPIATEQLMVENPEHFFELNYHETPWKAKFLMMEEYYSPVSRAWHLYSYPDLKWLYSFHGDVYVKSENTDSLVLGIDQKGVIGSFGSITFYKNKASQATPLFFLDEQLSLQEYANVKYGKAKLMFISAPSLQYQFVYEENSFFEPTKHFIPSQNILELDTYGKYSLILYQVKNTNKYHPSNVFPTYYETCWVKTSTLKNIPATN